MDRNLGDLMAKVTPFLLEYLKQQKLLAKSGTKVLNPLMQLELGKMLAILKLRSLFFF